MFDAECCLGGAASIGGSLATPACLQMRPTVAMDAPMRRAISAIGQAVIAAQLDDPFPFIRLCSTGT